MTDGENSANEHIGAATTVTPTVDEQPEPTLSASNQAREESKAGSASASALSIPQAHSIFSLKSKQQGAKDRFS